MQMFGNRESEIRKPTRQKRAKHTKPPMSYIAMISSAILSSPEKKMTLSEINEYLMDHHECFRGDYQGWRNSVRHNLSLNKCFVKILRNPSRPWAKDNHWGVIVDLLEGYLMENGKFRRRRKRQDQASRVQSVTTTRRSVSFKETKPAKSGQPVCHFPLPLASPPHETVLLSTSSYLMDTQHDHSSLTYNNPHKCSTTGPLPAAQQHHASLLCTSPYKCNTTRSFPAALQDHSSLLPYTCLNSPYRQKYYASLPYDRPYKWNSTRSLPVAHQVYSNTFSNSPDNSANKCNTIDLPAPHHDHSSPPYINSTNKWSNTESLPAADKVGFLCNSPSKRIAFSIENILGNISSAGGRSPAKFIAPRTSWQQD